MDFNSLEQENKYLKAKDKVKEIKKFYTNIIFYVVFIGFLALLNYYTSGFENMWFLWAALGWGIGIIFQAIKVFDWVPFANKKWEERKINELMEKDEEEYKNNRWN